MKAMTTLFKRFSCPRFYGSRWITGSTGKDIYTKGMDIYSKSLGWYDFAELKCERAEVIINHGYALLSMSRWLNRQDALYVFKMARNAVAQDTSTQDINKQEILDVIGHGEKMAHDVISPEIEDNSEISNRFYFYDNEFKKHQFEAQQVGFEEIEGVLSLLGNS